MLQGKVIQATGAWYHVQSHDGAVYPCKLRGKLRLQKLSLTNPVVVGDEVTFAPAVGVIHTVLPRKNYMIRRATHRPAQGQLLAANLDQALLVATVVDIAAQLSFIDNFLVVAEAFAITPGLVFNKLDLLDTTRQGALEAAQALYEGLGYATWAVSAHTRVHLDSLTQALASKVSLLSGHSGVGKSSLLNALAPAAQQAVAPVGASVSRGQHTTTYSALFEVAPGSFVIDMPGVQTLVPYALEKQALRHYFPELRALGTRCKFYNCLHVQEPGCAVRQALAQGDIAASRYTSYETMLKDTSAATPRG